MLYLNAVLGIVIILSVGLACAYGVIYASYHAVRCFRERRIRKGLLLLLPFLGVVFVAFLVLVAMDGARQLSQQSNCNNNLKEIILFAKMYANDHHESYPAVFEELNDTNYCCKHSEASVFVCPGTHHQAGALTNIHEWTDYAYVSGLSESAPSKCVVVFCLPEHHRGSGAYIGFVDGHIEWFPCKDCPTCKEPTFHDLTNTPSLFYGTTNEVVLADLLKRTRTIWPKRKP